MLGSRPLPVRFRRLASEDPKSNAGADHALISPNARICTEGGLPRHPVSVGNHRRRSRQRAETSAWYVFADWRSEVQRRWG